MLSPLEVLNIPKYVQIEGLKQGKFGGSEIFNHQPAIEVTSFSHKLRQPIDAGTGQPSGKTVHDAIRIVKKVDKTTVRFYMAMTELETLKSVLLSVVDPNRSSIGSSYFTIILEDSIVTEITQIKTSLLDPTKSVPVSFVEYEEIGLSYKTITWKYGDLSHSDGWRKPI
jgi:type VI secretion system Hcp family effector